VRALARAAVDRELFDEARELELLQLMVEQGRWWMASRRSAWHGGTGWSGNSMRRCWGIGGIVRPSMRWVTGLSRAGAGLLAPHPQHSPHPFRLPIGLQPVAVTQHQRQQFAWVSQSIFCMIFRPPRLHRLVADAPNPRRSFCSPCPSALAAPRPARPRSRPPSAWPDTLVEFPRLSLPGVEFQGLLQVVQQLLIAARLCQIIDHAHLHCRRATPPRPDRWRVRTTTGWWKCVPGSSANNSRPLMVRQNARPAADKPGWFAGHSWRNCRAGPKPHDGLPHRPQQTCTV